MLQAVDDRKNTLLKEYKASKRSNSFIDKRFGEADSNMTLEVSLSLYIYIYHEHIHTCRDMHTNKHLFIHSLTHSLTCPYLSIPFVLNILQPN